MTKKGIFILLPIILVAAWAGSSWHMGKQIEEKRELYLTSINQFLGLGNRKNFLASGSAITSAVKEYKRGIFSSHAIYEITFGKEVLSFDLSIEHGPLPLSQLTKFRFSPSTVGHLSVRKSALTEALFDNKGKFPAALNFIGYRDRLELNLLADYNNEIAEVRGATIKTSLPYASLNNNLAELQKNSIEIVAKIKKLSFIGPYLNSGVKIDNFAINYQGKLTSNADTSRDSIIRIDNSTTNYQGNFTSNYDYFTFHTGNVSFKSAEANVNLSKFELSSNMVEKQERFSRDLVIKSGKTAVNGKSYGDLNLSAKVSNLDKRTNTAISQLFDKIYQENKNRMLHANVSFLSYLLHDKELVSLLFKSGAVLDVDFNWGLQRNNSSYIAHIAVQKPTNIEDTKNPLSFIKTFTSELKLPIKALKLAISNVTPDMTKEQIDALDNTIEILAKNTPLLAFDDKNTLTSTLTYQDDSKKIILNSKEITKEKLIELLLKVM